MEGPMTFMNGDDKYVVTSSIAYTAQSMHDLDIPKEPWLHNRLVSITKTDANGHTTTAWYSCIYVWDTREIVAFVKHTKLRPYGVLKSDVHAIDNGQKLYDKNNLLPEWAKQKLCKRHLGT